MEIGIIGLGKMGGNLARQALKKRIKVAGFTLEGAPKDLVRAGLEEAKRLQDLPRLFKSPRVVLLYVPAGPSVDNILDELTGVLASGDVIADGGNSYWGDSIRRQERLLKTGIGFVDLGTSGGVDGALHGACFMAGGEKDAVKKAEPVLKALSVKDGYVHAGPPGSGHFVKLVHNGIEFGMLQAIGEGLDLLENYKDTLNIRNVLKSWRNGSVIRSWLVDLMHEAYLKEGGLKKIPSYVEDTGEVNWLVGDALKMEIPIPVISSAVMQLFASRDSQKKWAKAVAMMRRGFGGHPYGPSDPVRRERKEGRVTS
ncbi:MAG: 6-phosphogluconate dehydrogenase (decarboxylating) [Elusimicrobia bacterium RIFCSPLOWO2_01_FULL_60_11]|nr:MAG: 6-phosphogluconate dehydrogenase (decarboxylating) [Elusimicrobia bacterium RIFCSPLOWO2_01_FULL_60_11]